MSKIQNNRTTRPSATRADTGRESTKRLVNEALKEKYFDAMFKSKLDLPDSILQRFEADEMKLSWVRYFDVIKNRIDTERLWTKQNEGAVFVRPDEIPEFAGGTNKVDSEEYGTLVTRGDLALMKTPFEEYYARQAAKEDRVSQVTAGTIQDNKPSGVGVTANTTVSRGKRLAD